MNQESNDNYYILEEEQDESPRNFASYTDEEREVKIEKEKKEIGAASPFVLLLKIMFNTVEGWKSLRRSKLSAESLQSGCFYPLLAILALSKFADFFYSVNITLSQVITQSVIAFVAYFFGYFSVLMIMGWVLPKESAEKFSENFGKQYTLIGMSSLAIFSILINFLPMLWPILTFLPIWTLYILFKGARFFLLSEKQEVRLFIWSSVTMIGVPLLIEYGLNAILPY